jgi:hypothetical protein
MEPDSWTDAAGVGLAKLPRVAPSSHAVLLVGQQHDIPVTRLHKTQGALASVDAVWAPSITGQMGAGRAKFVFLAAAGAPSTHVPAPDVIHRMSEARWALGQGLPVSA